MASSGIRHKRERGRLGTTVKVAVAGATGFVGQALAARLVGDSHDVIALVSAGERGP